MIFINDVSGGGGGVNGSVFITNIVPQSSGNVGNKVYSSDGQVLDSCVADTTLLRVSILAITGHTNYKPVVTVKGIEVPLTAQSDKPLFTGTVNVDLETDSELTALHEDGASHTVQVSTEVPPIIENAYFTGEYPGVQTELKAGDSFQLYFETDKDVVRVELDNYGAHTSDATTFSARSSHTITINIANRGNSPQLLGAKLRVQTSSGSWSSYYLTEDDGSIEKVNLLNLNNQHPILNISSINYPASQQALKNSEEATVDNTASNYDTILYNSPNSQLSIANVNTFEASKIVQRIAGDYNISTTNISISANRIANDATTTISDCVQIANVAATITMSEPASRLRTGGNNGTSIQNHTITLTSNQNLLSAPTIANPSAGGGTWSGSFSGGPTVYIRTLQCHDSNDNVGTYSYNALSAINLAGIETTTYTGDATYTIGGFVSRTLTLIAFENEVSFGAAVSDYSKCTLTWSFKSLPNKRSYNTAATPDANSWCMAGTLNSQPTIARILDTAATSASSDDTTVTVAEAI